MSLSRHRWSFQFGAHPGRGTGGLEADIGHLQPHFVRNCHWNSRYCWQDGVRLAGPGLEVLVFELNYSILSNPLLMLRAKVRTLKRIGWGKGISECGLRRPLHKRLIERLHLAGCDAILAYGETSRAYFEGLGIARERIFVAQNTTDTTAILRCQPSAQAEGAQLRARLLAGDERPVVGYLGRLVPEKRVDAIIEAFAAVRHSGVDAWLVIAGDGPAAAALREQAARLPSAASVIFIKDVPAGAEHGFFQLFDIYVSYAVGGLGILEAMAHGRVIVSTAERRPELDLLVDGRTAFLSEAMSVPSFALRLRDALLTSAEGRRRIAAAARESVARSATQEKMVQSFDHAVDYVMRPAP